MPSLDRAEEKQYGNRASGTERVEGVKMLEWAEGANRTMVAPRPPGSGTAVAGVPPLTPQQAEAASSTMVAVLQREDAPRTTAGPSSHVPGAVQGLPNESLHCGLPAVRSAVG